jgi:hypothetical protein
MFYLLFMLGTLSPFIFGVILMVKTKSQRGHDADHVSYSIIFATDLRPEKVDAFFRSIGPDLRTGPMGRLLGVPTIVFEAVANNSGVEHRIHVPSRDAEYLAGQMDAHIPGTTLTPIKRVPLDWTYGVQLHMTDPGRMLRISNPINYSTRTLKAVQTDFPDETVMLQWVITGSNNFKSLSTKAVKKSSLFNAVVYGVNDKAMDDVIDEKAQERSFNAVGRVAAVAESPQRGKALVEDVVRALRSENIGNKFNSRAIRQHNLDDQVNRGAMTVASDVNLSVPELIPVVAWPIGDPQIQGVKQGSARPFPPVEAIPRNGGRLIGYSNISGRERPISQSFEDAVLHTFIGGKTGRGKTVQMANEAAADMKAGHGVIVIDASRSRSNETLFSRVLSYVPPERIGDVIVADIAGDPDNPLAYNLFDQVDARDAMNLFTDVFVATYPSVSTGVAVRDLLYHGLWTLIEYGGLTFVDLATLISPRTSEEKAWAKKVKDSVKEPELEEFWDRVDDGKGQVAARYSEPLHNKLWQLSGRPEIKHIIGQSKSTLNMRDVLENNKILLVSFADVPSESSELLASLFTSTLWNNAQAIVPRRSNFLYLDEFQVSSKVQGGLDDMLARARKHKLGVTLATQYLETVDSKLKTAIINNTGSRIIYETSATEARTWIPEFGGHQRVKETDFTGIRSYEAIATFTVGKETTPPVTLKALAPLPSTGVASAVLARSRSTYGRPIQDVRDEINSRRRVTPRRSDPQPKNFGPSPYEPKDQGGTQ